MNDLPPTPRPTHFLRDFLRLAGPWWTGPERWSAIGLTIVLLGFGVAQVLLAIRLNLWMADLFDAVERRAFDRFVQQVTIFALIVGGIMLSNSLQLLAKRRMQFAWRRFLVARVIGAWMDQARHYQVGQIPGDHANPDGRIAEDIRIATETAVELAASLFYSVLALASFVGILWALSGDVTAFGVAIPGHLVFLALLYAAGGSAVAWMLGRPLVQATNDRQTREADFRFGLVRARETSEPIALARGEEAERERLAREFGAIPEAWHAQSRGLVRLTFFGAGYGTLAPVFPILVEAPRLLAGALTLGQFMQAAQAFQQVTGALSWPVDNLQRIAEWRASVERVLMLEEAVQEAAADTARPGETAIAMTRTPGATIAARGLCIATPDGGAVLSDLDLEIGPGESVLITGESDTAAILFRVLAGIWPWGRGEVALPEEGAIAAVGARPFLADGTLRGALVFPAEAAVFEDAALSHVLERVGLPHLVERLDEAADWTQLLGAAEAQRLSIARLLLHRPGWILMGDALDALDPAGADALLALLREELPEAILIVTGRHPGAVQFFQRHLTLERSAEGVVMLHEIRARREAATALRRRSLAMVDWLKRGYGAND